MNIQSKNCIGGMFIFAFSAWFVLYSYAQNINPVFTIMLVFWFTGLSFSLINIKENIVLFCFLISFFVFLLGREICFVFLGLDRYYEYLERFNNITFLLITISLVFLYIGYFFPFRRKKISCSNNYLRTERPYNYYTHDYNIQNDKLRRTTKFAYYFCYVMSVVNVILQIVSVRSLGYLGTYISSNVSNSTILNYFSSFTIVAISLYLASFPSKKSSIFALITFEIYGILTMFTGHRYTFIAISMMFVTYVVYRDRKESNWISKKMVAIVIAGLPIVLFVMNYMDAIRVGKTVESGSMLDSIISFLDQQGGSINVIKRIFYYENQINDMHFTSLSNFRTVLFENLIIRKLFHIKVYSGNSIENAFLGHYLSHRLSYYEYGNAYLTGHGVGSCYIAELFHDFGFTGVCLGNFLYGMLLKKITELNSKNSIINGFLISSQYYLFLAPRGDFDGIIGGLFTVTSILGILSVIIISKCIKGR